MVKAYDAAGNVGTSAAATFVVYNACVVSSYSEVETNNTLATANVLADTITKVTGTLGSSTDQDYYKLSVGAGRTVTVSMTGPTNKDYDLYLLNSTGTTLKYSSTFSSNETLSFQNTGASAVFYIKVVGYVGSFDAKNAYTLTISR